MYAMRTYAHIICACYGCGSLTLLDDGDGDVTDINTLWFSGAHTLVLL